MASMSEKHPVTRNADDFMRLVVNAKNDGAAVRIGKCNDRLDVTLGIPGARGLVFNRLRLASQKLLNVHLRPPLLKSS